MFNGAGDVRFDSVTQKIYSLDASIFEVTPLGVSLPASIEELKTVVHIASKHHIPLIPRGSGTGIAGGCLGQGLVVDTSKGLNKILAIDEETALCEPGVIQDQLNEALSPLGKRLGPDTSTGDRATVGGMAACNAAGARSLYFGTMSDAIEELSLILSNGDQITLGPFKKEKLLLNSQEGEIYRTIENIRNNHSELIQKHFPPLKRRSSGYNLTELLKPIPNLAKLIAGSEGTLGIIGNIKLKIVPKLPPTELHLFLFSSMQEAMLAVGPLLQTGPISLELIDDKILEAGMKSPAFRGKLHWLKKIPKALLIAEYFLPSTHSGDIVIQDQEEVKQVWNLRKAGLGLLLSKRSYSRAVAFIEDVSVPPEALPEFLEAFTDYLKSKGKDAGIYGHVGPGCLHIRPYMDLRSPDEIQLMKTMMQDVAALLKKNGGALSGEHGDGLIRSWLNESLFGKEIIHIFNQIKSAFDPLGLMNPHKIVNPEPIEIHLRKAPEESPETILKFDGGLTLAADLCNGNGACRKKQGVMCPSFQVTGDEYDSTRGRANFLRRILPDLTHPDLHQILDLCIQCKGCKTECPSEVDMAKVKSEALYHYQKKYGYSLRSALFAYIDHLNRFLYPFRKWLNHFNIKGPGIAHPLPKFAKTRFSSSIPEQPQNLPIVLLSDTYTEFYCPEVGFAAIKVLNSLGFKAIVPPWQCCGRPAISKGFLHHAKTNAKRLTNQLLPYIEQKIPIVGLEPSCILTLQDEYRDLIPHWDPTLCSTFDAFLSNHPLPLKVDRTIALHGHCHQKALEGMQNTLQILRRIEGLNVIEIPSGCCGMAGSFGYEKEHALFSKQIGELKLLPFIRSLNDDVDIIASGYSCRTQIQLHTNKKAYHLAEWLALRK